jgi:hypothetical protein
VISKKVRGRYVKVYKEKGLQDAKFLAIASSFSLEELYLLLLEECGENEELRSGLRTWRKFYGKRD